MQGDRMIVTREEALALGLNKYFTGNPCKRGHVAFRYLPGNSCSECLAMRRQSLSWREKQARYMTDWMSKNRESRIAYMREYNKKIARPRRASLYYSDPLAAIAMRCRSRLTKAFSRFGYTKRSSTSDLVGCDWPTLKAHIERQFSSGMSWQNRSDWHIDHIRPLASATSEEELVSLCHYSNLRPLWAQDNRKKAAREIA